MAERLDGKIYVPSPGEIEEENSWIKAQILEIGEERLNGIARSAARVRKNAYNPYSKYSVGASLLTVGEEEYSSCNAEVVTYTETDHAERSVITKAISEGVVERHGKNLLKLWQFHILRNQVHAEDVGKELLNTQIIVWLWMWMKKDRLLG